MTRRTATKLLRLEYRSAEELKVHPDNWRVHGQEQLAALKDVIDRVGWAGALLYNERTKRLIDGHARKEIAAKVHPSMVHLAKPIDTQIRTVSSTRSEERRRFMKNF